MEKASRMYEETKTWNPFVGCLFGCAYCKPSFQAQLKRRKECLDCYNYYPHTHRKRLDKIPSAKIVFVAGDGDIAFCPSNFTREIINAIKEHNKRCFYKAYYLQSKNPVCFKQFLGELPTNVILLTTLETNKDDGCEKISKAPKPSTRYQDFLELNYKRKVVTIEPVMDFDLEVFTEWIVNIKPEYVWIGFNSRPKQVQLPEPTLAKTQELIDTLKAKDIEVRGKELRGLEV